MRCLQGVRGRRVAGSRSVRQDGKPRDEETLPWSGPGFGAVTIQWNASSLDVVPGGSVDTYWIWRQIPAASVSFSTPTGS
mgnify:CR=1 FL=1